MYYAIWIWPRNVHLKIRPPVFYHQRPWRNTEGISYWHYLTKIAPLNYTELVTNNFPRLACNTATTYHMLHHIHVTVRPKAEIFY